MHSCMCYHCSTRRLGDLHDLVLRLPARPYSGLVGEEASPPIIFTPSLWCVWYIPSLGLFIFTRCILKTLSFWRKLEDSAPFLRVLFFDYLFPTFFRKEFRSCRRTFSHWKFPRVMLRFTFHPILLAFSVLVTGFLISTLLSAGGLFGIFVPCSPWFLGGSPKFLKGMLYPRERCPWKSSPILLLLPFLDKEGFDGLLPFSLTNFFE